MVVFKWVLIGFNRFNGFNISICISVLYIYIHTQYLDSMENGS